MPQKSDPDKVGFNKATLDELSSTLENIINNEYAPNAEALYKLVNGGKMQEHWRGPANEKFVEEAGIFYKNGIEAMKDESGRFQYHFANKVTNAAEEATTAMVKAAAQHAEGSMMGLNSIASSNVSVGSENLLNNKR